MVQARQGGASFDMQLDEYLRSWPEEATTLPAFRQLLADPGDPFVRENLQAHFTGSAWVVSADGARTLLTHHRKLERWLQPGGHADGDRDRAGKPARDIARKGGKDDERGGQHPRQCDAVEEARIGQPAASDGVGAHIGDRGIGAAKGQEPTLQSRDEQRKKS